MTAPAWTTPTTAVASTLATAADWNSSVKGNGDYLEATVVDYQVGSRNRAYNGNFAIWQLGASPTPGNGNYTADGWLTQYTGGVVTVTQASPTMGALDAFSGYLLNAVSSGTFTAGDYGLIAQRVEDVRLLAGKTITVSFWAKAGVSTKVGVSIDQNFGSGGSPSATVTGTGQSQTITTSWARYQVQIVVASVSGKTLGTTATTSYSQVNLWLAAGSSLNTRSGTVGVTTTPFTVQLWGVQVEYAEAATVFEQEALPITWEKCQRYFEWNTGTNDSVFFAYDTTSAFGSYRFRTPKRATPVVHAYNGATIDQISRPAGTSTVASISGVTTTGFNQIDVTGATLAGYAAFNAHVDSRL